MYKNRLVKLLKEQGDSTLILKGEDPIVATSDFRNKYIRAHGHMKLPDKGVLVWDWTNNRKRVINPESVIRAIPLSKTLNNVREL